MKVIIGNIPQTTPDATTITVNASASDPVPTCQLSIIDNSSSLQFLAWQEIIILDEQQIPNPSVNMLQNPSMNPYTTNWTTSPTSGLTLSQITGGGVQAVVTNVPGSLITILFQTFPAGTFIPGQTYVFSIYYQSVGAVSHLSANVSIAWEDAASNFLSEVDSTPVSISTSLARMTLTATAPANASVGIFSFSLNDTDAGTNSGTVKFTQAQVEPVWFSNMSYPTPWIGPSQTNCRQLPLGQWIRQYRKFGGFVTGAEYGDYMGNKRTIIVSGSGYAILLSTILSTKTYTNQFDSAIWINLLNTYLTSQQTPFSSVVNMVNTSNVVQGVQLSSFILNYDDLRTAGNNLASQVGFYWTIDYYWSAIYAPPGYFSSAFSLIADDSSTPDNITTFPVYNFKAKMDATQPGSNVIVLGNGSSNTAQAMDLSQAAILGQRNGYFLPPTTSWMRKVNESTLNSANDCTARALAELLQYDTERYIYTLTTDNVELVSGYSVQVTSVTDNLNQTSLLIQTVKTTWIGKNEFLEDVWTYDATLGAVNRNVASILSRLFRLSNNNTSTPSIAQTTLVVVEKVGVVDTASTMASPTASYSSTVLGDTPQVWYRMDELEGTVVDDLSGNQENGTLHGTVTLAQTGAIIDGNFAMLFDGSTGYAALPTAIDPHGYSAISIELWIKPSTLTLTAQPAVIANDVTGTSNKGAVIFVGSTGTAISFVLGNGTTHTLITATFSLSTSVYAHVVGTWSGTSMKLYVNGTQLASGSFTGPIASSTNPLQAGHNPAGTDYFPGDIDEVAVYNYALTGTQISNHYSFHA